MKRCTRAASSSWTGSSAWAPAWSSAIPTALVHGPASLRGEPGDSQPRHPGRDRAPHRGAVCRRPDRDPSIEQIDRGYEDIEGKLLALGARITRRPDSRRFRAGPDVV